MVLFPDDLLEDALLILLPSKDGAARAQCGLATNRNGQILDIFRSNVLEVGRQGCVTEHRNWS